MRKEYLLPFGKAAFAICFVGTGRFLAGILFRNRNSRWDFNILFSELRSPFRTSLRVFIMYFGGHGFMDYLDTQSALFLYERKEPRRLGAFAGC